MTSNYMPRWSCRMDQSKGQQKFHLGALGRHRAPGVHRWPAVAPLDERGLSQQAWIQQHASPALVALPARTEQGTASRAWCANPAAAASQISGHRSAPGRQEEEFKGGSGAGTGLNQTKYAIA